MVHTEIKRDKISSAKKFGIGNWIKSDNKYY